MLSPKITVRRTRFWWSLFVAYLTRYKFWFLGSFFVAVLLFFLSYKIFYSAFKPNVVTIGYVGSYSIENIPASILSLATDSLVAQDESGKPTPVLASHWTTTDDGKEYIVFLKDNIRWSDDTPVLAKDISIAIKNVDITAINNKAIHFKLPNPIPSFPLLLNKPVFKANSFYGTADYLIVEIDQVDNLVRKIVMKPKSKDLPEVEIKFYQTEELALNALKIGEIKNLTIANAGDIASWPNMKARQSPDYTEIMTVFFNTQDPLLSSKEFRQALSYSINTEELNGEASRGPISPKSWAFNQQTSPYTYNIGKAKELLTKSQAQNPQLTLKTTKDLEQIAYKIKEFWEEIGVKVEIEVEKQIPKDFQALLVLNKVDPDPDQYTLWHSTQQENNLSNFADVRVDKYLEDGRSLKEEDERREVYADFQRVLLEEAPAIFLYYPYKYSLTYKNVEDLISKLPELN